MSNRRFPKTHGEALRRRELAHQLVLDEKSLHRELSCITNEEKKVLEEIEAREKVLSSEHPSGLSRKKALHRPVCKTSSWNASRTSVTRGTTRENKQSNETDRKTRTEIRTPSHNSTKKTEQSRTRRNRKTSRSNIETRERSKSQNDLFKEESYKNDEIPVKNKCLSTDDRKNTEDSLCRTYDRTKISRSLEHLEVTSNCSVESNPPSSENLSSSEENIFHHCTSFPTLKKGPLVTRLNLSSQEAKHKDDFYDPVKEWQKRLERSISYTAAPGDSSPNAVRRVLTKHISCPLPYSHTSTINKLGLRKKHDGHQRLCFDNHYSCLPCEARRGMLKLRDNSKSSPNSSQESADSDELENSELRKCRYIRFPKYVKTYPEDLIDLKECSKFVAFYHKKA